ncbi:hypothetical protein [Sediminicoccus rosea]|uniref:Uncharacterized protein n=1 Tax=Sediminicoccus rosea TaxID=1225128 RepID=A0ABZ0PK62_9PROT|nr:hypothetical protein [Sediminicoccus rosea]WPB86119.1 hypothetical protein R9Z33_04425 [Sediminicoccus rosea]
MTLLSRRHARQVAQPTPTGWMFFQAEAPLTIDIRAGEAANIGGIGQVAQNMVFADRAARDAACPPAWRNDRTVYGPLCDRWDVNFLRHDMARDRARILARFPALAALSLVDRPLAPTPQWPLWPDVLMRRA